jgi:hypothetical protein
VCHSTSSIPRRTTFPNKAEASVPELEVDQTIAPRPEEEVADVLRAKPKVDITASIERKHPRLRHELIRMRILSPDDALTRSAFS